MSLVRRIFGGAVAGATLLSAGILLAPTAVAAPVTSPVAETPAATGTAYHVDCLAETNGDGSEAKPFNSFTAVNAQAAKLKAGDQILFKRGTTCNGENQTINGTANVKAALRLVNVRGTAEAPIVVSDYGDKNAAAPILAGNGVADVVLLRNSEYITVQNLDITNTDTEANRYKYMRRGITAENDNAGELKGIVIRNNSVHDIYGERQKDLGGSSAIQLENYGRSIPVDGADKTKGSVKADTSRKIRSWFNDVQIVNNTITNVNRSGINMSSDFRCREDVAWECGVSGATRDQYPWTPNLNLYIAGNTLKKIGGDGIVVQMADGAVVEKNYLEDAASVSGQGSNAGIWNWNADNTLFQFNEVTNTQKTSGNNDGTAWDFDYGTRNTVFQYNYSHDNSGGAALVCACTDWYGKTDLIGTALGGVFRYNLSVNDGVQASNAADSESSNQYRTIVLDGITDMNVYNNTVVLPKGNNVTFSNNAQNAGVTYNNNVIIAQDGTNMADQNEKINNDGFQINYGNNLYVGGEKTKWAKADANGNQHVALADYLTATGVDLAAVAKGDLSSLYSDKATGYAATKGRAMATDGLPFTIKNKYLDAALAGSSVDFPHGFSHATQTYGKQFKVSGWSAPAVGAFQGADTTETGKAADLTAGKSTTIDVPGNATLEITATTAGDAQLAAAVANDRGYTQTTSGEAGKKTLFVRTSSDSSKLTLTNTGKTGTITGISARTVQDQLWDGSFESINNGKAGQPKNGISPWAPANRDHSKNRDGYDDSRVKRYRSDLNQANAVVTGERAAKLGKQDGVSFTQIDQRNIPAQPGKTYQLGFWLTTGDSTDDKSTASATIKYRKEGSGAGGSFSQYATQLLAVSVDGKTAKAGEKLYVTGTFTVPWDAVADSALWLNIAQNDLKDGSFAYVDNVTLTEVATPATGITSIAVTKQPTKTAYKTGEELETAGLEVTATLNDGKTRKLDASEYTVLGFDSTKAGTVTVTVKLNADGNLTATFDVTIKEEINLANKFCSSATASDVEDKWSTSKASYTCDDNLATNWSNWKDASQDKPDDPAWLNWTFDKKHKLDNLYFYIDQNSGEAAPSSVKVQYLGTDDKTWVDTDITFTPNSDKSKATVADLSKLPATKAISLILTASKPSNENEYPYVKVAEVKIIQADKDEGYTPVKSAENVPATDNVPTYTKFEAIADPGTSDKNYFQPLWYAKDSDTATTGHHIQAHGGQVVPVQENGKTVYYWYGEDRSSGYYNSHGVHVYRSEDGLNWGDKGIALRSIYYDDELTDDYFVNLYGLKKSDGTFDTAKAKKIAYYLNTSTDEDGDGVKDTANAIFERPKVLYNAKTKKYVMWWHADGSPTISSTSNYARSLAGVAVSDSPTGPFKLVGAYRLPNREDYKTGHNAAVPGGSRDMTVFQDADGTAYVIYSSEENRTLYIAKLNDEYTNVVKTTKDAANIKDLDLQYSESGEYPYTLADGKAGAPVSGEDFVIVKDRGMLEAPAMFKYGSKYYIIASGATGWAPNKQTYYTADSILGTWIRGIEADDKYEETQFQSLPEGADGLLSVGDTRGSTFGSQSASVFEYKPGKFIYIGDRWHAGAADSTYVWLPLVIDKTTGRLTMQNPATQDPTAYGDGWDANYWDETVDNPLNLASITVNGKAIDGFAGTTLSYTVDTGVWGKVPTVEAKAVNANDVTVTTDVNTERAIITVTSKADKSKTRVYRVTFSSTTEGSTAVSDPWKTTSWGNASAFAQGADGTNLLRITDKSNTGAWTDKDNLSTIYQPAKLGVGDTITTTIVSSQPGNNEDPRAGIIVRNDLSVDGKGKAHGYALLVAGLNGSFFQTDSDNNGFIDKESAKVVEAATSTDTPLTIRLVRNSKTELEGFYQVPGTGVNGTEAEWKSIGKATLGEDAADKLDVGVFAVSNNGRGDYTAIFGNTTIAPKPAPTVTGIKVTTAPAKAEYTVGDTFAEDGLKVVKTLSDGTSADVDAADYSLSAVAADGSVVDLSKPFADAAVGKVTVTVALKADPAKTATFDVTVKAKPIVTTGIKVTAEPTTVKYTVGQTFAADGLSVVKTQSNGIDVPLTADDYSLSAVAADGSVVDLSKPFADAAVGSVTVTVALKSDASGEQFTDTFELTVEKAPVTLASIEIVGKPSKTEYQVGEKFAADGLSVEKVMSDGTKVPAAGSEYTLTAVAESGEVIDLTKPFAETAIGTVTVTVNVDDKTATFELTVKAKPIVTTGIKVAAAPAKAEYTVGDTFAEDGLKVVKTLSDGTSADVDAADYSLSAVAADGSAVDLTKPFAKAAVGKVTVTVALKSDASKTATFELTVKAKSDGGKPAPEHKVVALKVAAAPTKTKYTVGETFAAAGLKVVKVLDDGTEVALDAAGYTLTAVDAFGGVVDLSKPFAAEGKVTFTVTLNGSAADAVKPATFSVSVAKKADEGKTPAPAPAPKPAPTTPAKKPGLSDTGASVAGVAGVAALLLAAGAAVTLARRRRG